MIDRIMTGLMWLCATVSVVGIAFMTFVAVWQVAHHWQEIFS